MKQVFSILLTFAFLASHIYLSVGTHYCNGEPVETKLIAGEAHLGCGMSEMHGCCEIPAKQGKGGTTIDKVPCCENKYQSVHSVNEFINSGAQVDFFIDFAVEILFSKTNLDVLPIITHQNHAGYISPPVKDGIQELFQVFRC